MYLRREFLYSILCTPFLLREAHSANSDMVVYKDPTCGCCDGWIAHLKASGFLATVKEVDNTTLRKIKEDHRIPSALQSCHTGLIEGYVIEGHVPAESITRL